LEWVWVGSEYGGVVAKLVKAYKFERMRDAYKPLTQLLQDSLPYGDWQIVPIPTAPNRIRQRGYDQTLLLAKALAHQRKLPLTPLLRRAHDSQQVGSSRKQRLLQAKKAFYLTKATSLKGAKVVLIDDVCTTGATLAAAANLLKQAGASQVNAVVCAWQAPS
jgi:ComF family protein